VQFNLLITFWLNIYTKNLIIVGAKMKRGSEILLTIMSIILVSSSFFVVTNGITYTKNGHITGGEINITNISSGRYVPSTAIADKIGQKVLLLDGIEILKPSRGYLYINNEGIKSLPLGATVVIGLITIEVKVSGFIPVGGLHFYVDGKEQYQDNFPPYSWDWSSPTFGFHKIEVKTYNIWGSEYSDEIWVFKLF